MIKPNQKRSTAIYIGSLLLLIATAQIFYYPIRTLYRPKVYRYVGFGINLPTGYSIHGIDVSHYQSIVNWQDVKQMEYQHTKIGFSFIKATDGAEIVDENYLRNWNDAKNAGIITGAYHFFRAGTSGKTQALNFIGAVDSSRGDLPPVLDIEQTNEIDVDSLKSEIKDWLVAVEDAYHVKPIIYTYVDFYDDCLKDDFDDYPLWIANYVPEDKPNIERNWIFWQHSDRGHVNGIGGIVDFDVFNGDSTAFMNLLRK